MPYRHYPDSNFKLIPVRPDAHRIAKQVADQRKVPIIKIVTDLVMKAYPTK